VTTLIEAWMAELEATVLAAALRGSVWAYPLVNAGHILGVALLIGSIVPLDLRLLGLWQAVPLASLWRVLTRITATALLSETGAVIGRALATWIEVKRQS
jgi:hypothetical protein